MLKHCRLPVFLSLTLLFAACAPAAPQRPSQDLPTLAPPTSVFSPDDAPAADIPIASSAEVERFVWQTDGVYGYRMLRPAGWTMSDSGMSRGFIAPLVEGQMPMALQVVNLTAKEWAEPWGVGGFFRLFQSTGSFDAWVAALERREFSGARKIDLPADLAGVAAVYLAQSDGAYGRRIMPFGFKISEGQPLMMALEGNVGPDDLDGLKASGAWDDFVTMLRSLSAIPADAANVTPWAPTATPVPTPQAEARATVAPQAEARATGTSQAEARATAAPQAEARATVALQAEARATVAPQAEARATVDVRLMIWPSLDTFEQELSRAVLGPLLANRVCEWAMLTGSTDPYYVWATCMAYDSAPHIAQASSPAVIRVDPANGVTVQVPREGEAWAGDVSALFPEDAQTKIFAQAIQPIIPEMLAHARLRIKWPGLPPLAAAAFEPPQPYNRSVSASVSMYSGLPDPAWTLTRLELARLDELLRDLPTGQCPAPFEGLGYRGVVVGLGGLSDAGHLHTTNGYVWSGDLGLSADAFCFVDTDHRVERFLLSSAAAYTEDPALRELLSGLGGPLPTPMVTPSPTPTVAPGFVWWGDEGLGIEFYHPDAWELGAPMPLSRAWQTPAAPNELPRFWFTILPPNYPYTDTSAYNFWTPDEIARAWETPVGQGFVSAHAPEGFNAYTRLPDMTVDGFPAAVVASAQERRALVKVGGLTIMFGTYYIGEDDLRVFETALRSVKFGSLITLSGAAALTPLP